MFIVPGPEMAQLARKIDINSIIELNSMLYTSFLYSILLTLNSTLLNI